MSLTIHVTFLKRFRHDVLMLKALKALKAQGLEVLSFETKDLDMHPFYHEKSNGKFRSHSFVGNLLL